MRLKSRFPLFLALLFAAAACAQTTRNVGPGQSYTTIQSAISAANDGDTVLVAPGTYDENIDFLGKAITVTSSAGAASTIIDGGAIPGTATVVFQHGEQRSSVISGFTIRNGGHPVAVGPPTGGVFVSGGAPTILNNIITANACVGIEVNGGSALIQGNDVNGTLGPTNIGCSAEGSAIFLEGSSGAPYNSILGNTIERNQQGAAAIWVYGADSILIQNNVIRFNNGGDAGGIYVIDTDNIQILQNLIYDNAVTGTFGDPAVGGISILAPYTSVGPFTGIIAGNTISGNTFSGANFTAGETATDVGLSGNLAQFLLVNNIIDGSSAAVPALVCGTDFTPLDITPLVFDHNDIYNAFGAAYSGSCPDQTGTYGNISADPLFADPTTGNYRINAASPAIDAGNDSAPLIPSTDLAGNARIQNATGTPGPIIDMGAYEFFGQADPGHTVLTLTPSEYFTSATPTPAPPPLTFTAALSSAGGQPTGTVAIYEDTTLIGTVAVGSSGSALLSGAALTSGIHAFTAVYPAPGTSLPSGEPFATAAVSVKFYLLVPSTVTSLTLTSTPNPSAYSQYVAFNVTASSANGVVPSPITLHDSYTNYTFATLTPDASGNAPYSTNVLTPGTHTITAAFAGNATQSASSTSITQVVQPIPTTSAIVSPANGAVYNAGAYAVINAQITPALNSYGPVTGTMAFYTNGAVAFSNAAIGNNTSQVILFNLTPGTYTLTCLYSGDTNYASSSCPGITITVKGTQTITFPPPASAYAQTSVALAATSSSGLPVAYSVISGPAFLSGSTLTYTGPGTVVVEADQAGNSAFPAAAPVQQSINVTNLTVPVATTSSTVSTLLTFATAGTLNSLAALTQGTPSLDFNVVSGGSCAIGTTYAANQTCSVNFTFTPTVPGQRLGGIAAYSGSTLLASSYVAGTGTGPLAIFTPANETLFTTGVTWPSGLAIDASGNAFLINFGSNEVLKVTQTSPTSYSQTVVTTGLVSPESIAIDGLGDVFITNTDNDTIVKETPSGSGYNQSVVYTSPGGAILGVAVDAAGDLFLSQWAGNDILKLSPNASGGYSQAMIFTVPAPLYPEAVKVDGTGNVFLVEENLSTGSDLPPSTIVELTPAGSAYIPSVVDTNLTDIRDMAIDDAGNIYLAQGNNLSVSKEVPSSSGYTRALVASNLPNPTSVALDGHGNLFVGQFSTYAIRELDFATPATVPFATTAVGSTSSDSPRSVTISNDGNAALNFLPPASGNNPSITAGFTLGSTSTCPLLTSTSAIASLAPNTSCSDSVSFRPIAPGTITGQLNIVDNNLNAASALQIVPLTGNATGTTPVFPSSSTLTASPNPATFGASVTITATVSPTTTSTSVSAGSVTFYDNGVNIGTANVSSSVLPNAVASLTTSALPAGSNSLTCVYSGDTSFAPSTCPAFPLNVLAVLTAQTITFTPPATAYSQTSIALNATATSNLPVTFKLISGPAYLNGSTLTYTGPGTVVVEADQPGNATFTAAPPVQQTITVTTLTEPVHATIPALVSTLITFSSSGTLSNIATLTQGAPNLDFTAVPGGNDCTVGTTYSAGQTCIVHFSFNPTSPGARYGGLTLTDASGNLLAGSPLFGIGTGPQVIFTPAPQSTLISGVKAAGLAFDGAGNLFVADSSTSLVKEYTAASNYQTFVPVGSGFSSPSDLAVDGSGNLFVTDQVNGTISEVLAADNYATTIIVASGFVQPPSIAIDASGNLFVPDGQKVFGGPLATVKELLASTGYTTVLTLPATFIDPQSVALDSSGNLFVADYGNSSVLKLTAASSYAIVTPIPGTFDFPSTLAIDTNDNIFLTDSNSGLVELLSNSAYATVVPLSSQYGVSSPTLDGRGNLFVSSFSLGTVVKFDFLDPPTLYFAPTNVGSISSDSPQTVTLNNNGNAPLTFLPQTLVTNPSITPGFQLTNTRTAGACPVLLTSAANSASLAPGASCTDSIEFAPISPGGIIGLLVTGDTNLNVFDASQIVTLNASGTLDLTTPNLTATPNPAIQGATVTVTAVITNFASDPVLPTGTVTFADNGISLGGFPVTGGRATFNSTTFAVGNHNLTCTYSGDTVYQASTCNPVTLVINPKVATTTTAADSPEPSLYGQPVTFSTHVSAVSGTAIPTGNVTFTFCHGAATTVTLDATGNASYIYPTASELAEPVGSCPFTAQYTGDANFATSTSAPVAYIVLPAPSTTTLTASPNPSYLGQPVTLTATVAGVPSPTLGPGGQIIPPGIQTPTSPVSFYSNGTLLGQATIANGIATLITTTLPAGTDTLQAVYPGDNNLTGSSSTTISEIILLPDFTLTATPPSLTLVTGHRGSLTLTLASLSGWTGPVAITCPNLPPFATCYPTTVNLPANGSISATFALDTSGVPQFYGANQRPAGPHSLAQRLTLASLLPLALLLLPGSRRKHLRARLLHSTLTLALLTVATTALTSCSTNYPDFTPPGTYTLAVTATGTDANLTTPTSHTLNVTLVVTQ